MNFWKPTFMPSVSPLTGTASNSASTPLICALPAFWVGLLYDQGALDAAWDLVRHWTMAEREELRNAVPALALDAPLPGRGKLRDIAGHVLDIAHAGLTALKNAKQPGAEQQ